MYPEKISEEELKNKIAQDFFSLEIQSKDGNLQKGQKRARYFDTTQILGRIDFCVSYRPETLFSGINFLWAEAKKGSKADIIKSFVQLVLTIGKERTFANELPPLFLGAFDCEKIAFIPYIEMAHIFTQNDFNWNVTPSDHDSKEFKQLYEMSKALIESQKLEFKFAKDAQRLREFIACNFTLGNTSLHKLQVDKNNFMGVYQLWLQEVKDSISVNWELAKKEGILDSDFFLADLLSDKNKTLKDKLFVVLVHSHYELMREPNSMGLHTIQQTGFNDSQKAHQAFWNLYERPPKKEYWDYIIERRDLLVPSDIRERKGAFFTPRIWVVKAQEYLAKALGEDWQSEYIIWDCAAGTGNLLANLTESRNLYASTIDRADVDIMRDLSRNKSLALLENHIFQFNFLNDLFFDKPCDAHKDIGLDSECQLCIKSKLPESLQKILSDEEKRKKLVIFINPPYAEAGSSKTQMGTGQHKERVSLDNVTYENYKDSMGKASNELFAQFFFRIYKEIPDCILASFSTLKYVNSSNFMKFRGDFQAKFLRGFVVPAFSFDNVKGQFPIGFLIWDLSKKNHLKTIRVDVFNQHNAKLGTKKFYVPDPDKSAEKRTSINRWLRKFRSEGGDELGILMADAPDFQQSQHIALLSKSYSAHLIFQAISAIDLISHAVYFAVRLCIKATWLNDRDQFLYPKDSWRADSEFHYDCLAFTLFHGQNKITCKEGVNHFIPFKESEVGAKEAFESDFMVRFVQGKLKPQGDSEKSPDSQTRKATKPKNAQFDAEDFYIINPPTEPIIWSEEAQRVIDAGRELWKHYHAQASKTQEYLVNASLYDIKGYFQGFSPAGKMNTPAKAKDEVYKTLIGTLSYELGLLAKKLEPKVYEYGFLEE